MARNSLLVLQILEVLGNGRPMGLSELTSVLGSPKTSVHRAIGDLVEEGWLRSTGQAPPCYFLSGKVLRIAQGSNGMAELSIVAGPVLDRLHRQTGENVQLSTLEDGYIVAFERRESSHALRVHLPLGERVHWHATAVGRAIAAHLAPERLQQLLSQELPALTASTITSRIELQLDIDRGYEQGYVVSDSGWRMGVVAIGAPVLDPRGYPIAGLSVNSVASRMTASVIEAVAPLVRDAAREIGGSLQ